jgi:gamma-glutamyltranspeptidase/glutathione hydrolase
MQPQGHVQVLLNILRGFTAQTALDAPRFCISPGSPNIERGDSSVAGDVISEIYFEDDFSNETINTLRG